jgi:hypothetical protein
MKASSKYLAQMGFGCATTTVGCWMAAWIGALGF